MSSPQQDGRSTTGHFANYDQLYITIADLKGRLTSFIEVTALRDETQRQEIQRLREDMLQRERDHEERIRMLEQRKYVEPKTVLTAISLSVAALGVFTAIVNVLISIIMK